MLIDRFWLYAVAAMMLNGMTAVSVHAHNSAELSVAEPRCEFRQDPLGVETKRPRLSWKVRSSVRAIVLTAFQVQVAGSPNELAKGETLLWDSGKIAATDPTSVIYAGPPLVAGQRYFWKVRVWDADENTSAWSNSSWWEMGLLNATDWQAEWIDDGRPIPKRDEEFYVDDPALLFRKTFKVSAPVKRARLYIAGLGYYEASLNGQRVGELVLDPAWTTYSKRVLYSTYDVTDQINAGQNCLGVTVGNGWYNPLPLRMWGQLNLRKFLSVGRPRFVAQLDIEFTDGHHTLVVSDRTWKKAYGPILRNSIYLGEVYDARREIVGWNKPEIDDTEWDHANRVDSHPGILCVQSQPPIRQSAVLPPIARTQPKPGVFIFDFGQNLAGWVRLHVQGPAGTKVTMRFGELLYPDGTLNTMTTVCGQIKKPGVGGPGAPQVAEQADSYILSGRDPDAMETYVPRFTYHGFRYVELTGFPGQPGLDAVEAIRLTSTVESTGEFSCSNDLLNRIQLMCRATFPSNLIGVQTDCPGRERFGYGDDIACACEAHLYNFDMATFYPKTAQDFADAARPNGALTLLAPWTGHAIGGFDDGGGSFANVERNGANAGSGALSGMLAHPLLVQKNYQFYGDERFVEQQYETARSSLEFLRQHADDHLIKVGLGDWSSVEPTNTAIMDTALYYQHARIVSQLARTLKRNADANEYEALAGQIKSAFIKAFLENDADKVGFNTQAARACSLYHGLLPPNRREAVSQALALDVLEHHQGHLSTGIFGTKYLLDALTDIGRADVAYGIVGQTTYPSWGYMLARGATTLWEVWDYSDDVYSHNHSMFGTVSAWFFARLGGIMPADDAVGFNKIVLAPHVVPGLSWVKTTYRSIRGDIVSNWRIEGDEFVWDVTIPPTASAIVCFPAKFSANVREGNVAAASAKGTEQLMRDDSSAKYRIKSGSYSFRSQQPHVNSP